MDLEVIIKLLYEPAEIFLLGTKRQLAAQWVLVDSKDGAHLVATPWMDERDKGRMLVQVRRLIGQLNARAYGFISEGWWVFRQEWPYEASDYVPDRDRPTNQPDRRECLNAFATDGKNKVYKCWTMQRDNYGRCTALVEQTDAGGELSGRMTELLD